MTIVSYAQFREDILLLRALKAVPNEIGFYIDVGAYDPKYDSVTKLFYDHGWHGINIEPSPQMFARLSEQRPRDINLQVAASNTSSEAVFHDVGQLGTLVTKFADQHAAAGLERRTYIVQTRTLTEICEKHAPKEIHFLKIDVEGYERQVLEGTDFCRFRPWILVIEAVEPNNLNAPTYHGWDQLILNAGYRFAYTDVLNRYYVASEHAELIKNFGIPPDNYVLAADLRHRAEVEPQLGMARERIQSLEQEIASIMLPPDAIDPVQREIRAALSLLTPKKAVGYNKVRVGRDFDGGYIMVDQLDGAPVCYSIGVGFDASWDLEMAFRGCQVYQYDPTVDRPDCEHPNFHFQKIGVAADDDIPDMKRLDTLVAENGHADQLDLILKVDIEGQEWSSFEAVPAGWFARFSQIAVELHWLDHLHDQQFRSLFTRVIGNICSTHECVHVHANNHAAYAIVHGLPIPQVAEVTFLRKENNVFIENNELLPGHLDRPNNPNLPDYFLGLFRFQ